MYYRTSPETYAVIIALAVILAVSLPTQHSVSVAVGPYPMLRLNKKLAQIASCEAARVMLGVTTCTGGPLVDVTMSQVANLRAALDEVDESHFPIRKRPPPTAFQVTADSVQTVAEWAGEAVGVVPLRGVATSVSQGLFRKIRSTITPRLDAHLKRWGSTREKMSLETAAVIARDAEAAALALMPTIQLSLPPLRYTLLRAAKPRLIYLHQTLTPEQCQEIMHEAERNMQRSSVIAGNDGQSEVSMTRSSSGMFFLTDTQRSIVANVALRAKVASALGIEWTFLEDTQVLRYRTNERYVPHMDAFDRSDTFNLNRGGQRIATAITWLNTVEDGSGTTSFPQANIRISPAIGDTVIFYDVDAEGQVDYASTHGGDPLHEGMTKWVAVLWAHPRVFT